MSLATSLAGVSLPLRFAALSVALLLVATVGFWPSYLAQPWKGIDPYTHLHAIFGTAWMIILIAQPLLIRSRKMAAHRLLGRVSIVFAAAFVVSGILLAHARFSSMPPQAFVEAAPFLSLPLSMTVWFAAAYLLALQWRKSPPVHARFMAATAVALIDPALGRAIYFLFPPLPALWMYQAVTFPVMAGILIAMLISLPSGMRGKVAFRWFAMCAITVLALLAIVPSTEAWLAFARWFRELPLT